jgi:hypothetical protein
MGAPDPPEEWRRGRDSNPGPGSTPGNRLAGGCLRPTRPPLRASVHLPGGPGFCQLSGPLLAGLAEGEGFEPPLACAHTGFQVQARGPPPPTAADKPQASSADSLLRLWPGLGGVGRSPRTKPAQRARSPPVARQPLKIDSGLALRLPEPCSLALFSVLGGRPRWRLRG